MNAKTDLSKTANFIEEFAWFLQSKKNINLEEAAKILRDLSAHGKVNGSTPRAKADELVGMLPFLFQDKDLFKQNKDIIDFAEDLFGIPITRHGKRSRYEIIGWVVTEVSKLDRQNIDKRDRIIDGLSSLYGDSKKLKEIKKAKNDINFSWNEAIANLNK